MWILILLRQVSYPFVIWCILDLYMLLCKCKCKSLHFYFAYFMPVLFCYSWFHFISFIIFWISSTSNYILHICILVPLTEFSKDSLEKHINLNVEIWQWDNFLFPYFTILYINRTCCSETRFWQKHIYGKKPLLCGY